MMQSNPYAINIQDLTFRYPDRHLALQNISFQVKPQEKVALVGMNGSGKSTLLLQLNGVLRATSGTISIFDKLLSDETISHIRATVGLLFQNPDDQLFSPHVYDDVAFAPRYMGLSEDEVNQRVTQALKQVDMSDFGSRISYHLSTGQKKRIALASILSADARILALDEPSAGLDPRSRRNLINLLKAFDEHTLIISTHDMRLAAELCNRAIVLDSGHIVADGASDMILYDQTLMEKHGLETP